MGFANTITVTLSSVGQSRAILLDYMNGTPTAVTVTSTATTSTFVYTVQYSLDDVMQTPAANVVWVNDPNATALTSNSSGAFLYQQPPAGIRLSSSTAPPAALTMKVTQGSYF